MDTIITREQQLERALFRGAALTLQNPDYAREVRAVTDALLRADLNPKDLTVAALEIQDKKTSAVVLAREPGIAAGCAEFAFLAEAHGISVGVEKADGETFQPEDTLLRLEGGQNQLLSLERVGLNLLQRMCGIATSHPLPAGACRRALHLHAHRRHAQDALGFARQARGASGRRRNAPAGLGRRHSDQEQPSRSVCAPRRRCGAHGIWRAPGIFAAKSAFIEVEVRGEAAALRAADTFRQLQKESGERYPCLLMLDNLAPREISPILESLRREGLWDYALIEASGGISRKTLKLTRTPASMRFPSAR